MKLQHKFHFPFPLYRDVVKNLKKERIVVNVLFIEGHYSIDRNAPRTEPDERYLFEINEVTQNGVNIMETLELLNAMDEISGATLAHIAALNSDDVLPDDEDNREAATPAPIGCNNLTGAVAVNLFFDSLNKCFQS